MKKLFLLAMITAMVATTAVAQYSKDQPSAKQDHTAWEKKIKADLNLTTDQSAKFDAISAEFNTKIQALKKDEASTDKESFKEKKMALRKEREAKIVEILTPEQQAKYKELLEKAKADMKKPS
jgi:Spy/CpxP family protein refolding chaperone